MGPPEFAAPAIRATSDIQRHKGCLRRLAISVALLHAAPFQAWAFNWDYVPTITTGGTYDTNVLYSGSDFERSAGGVFVDARVDLRGETELHQLSLRPRVRSTWYPGARDSDLDYTDLYLTAIEAYTGDRNQLSLTAEVDRTSTRTSEFEPGVPENPDQPAPIGSGRIVNVNEFRTLYDLAPSWHYVWSDLMALDWSASVADVRYSQAIGPGRFNYRNYDSELSLNYRLTPQILMKIGGVGSLFHTAETFSFAGATSSIDNDTVQSGANGTLQYTFSPTLDGSVTLGWNHSSIEVASAKDLSSGLPCLDPTQLPALVAVRCHTESSQDSLTWQLFLRKRSESTTANVSLNRGLYPSSEGYTVTQTGVNAFVIRNITDRLAASAGINGSRQESVGGLSTRRSDYASSQVGLSWRIREGWSVSGNYQYIFSRQSGRTAVAQTVVQTFSGITHNQQVSIQLQWQGLGRHP